MTRAPRRALSAAAIAALICASTVTAQAVDPATVPGAKLMARAVLPADTFADGPPSGAQITGSTNGRTVPFTSQPVQGVSGFISAGDGAFWALSDNGFGAKENSRDYLLRVYKMRPAFETASGGPGTVTVERFIQLSDPDRKVAWPIVNNETSDRLLTGADFDIESVRQDAAGGLWFGDEFGPFLLHTDANGRLLDAPFSLPNIKAPQNPLLNATPGDKPNLPTSRGFEGAAMVPGGRTLYPMLEGPITDDPSQRRRYI
jgi:hypothetical protein